MSMIKDYLHHQMDQLDAMADIEMYRNELLQEIADTLAVDILNEIADHQYEQAMDQPEPKESLL